MLFAGAVTYAVIKKAKKKYELSFEKIDWLKKSISFIAVAPGYTSPVMTYTLGDPILIKELKGFIIAVAPSKSNTNQVGVSILSLDKAGKITGMYQGSLVKFDEQKITNFNDEELVQISQGMNKQ